MTGPYAVLAGRIRQDLAELDHVVARVERALAAGRERPDERDLFVDSAALNLHDYYTGPERTFTRIAAGMDKRVPSGPDWHRELLRQMTLEIPELRPPVLTALAARDVDEFLRFRHVVRHVYAFALDEALVAFTRFLEDLAR
ncbi:MAG: hypothetical protein IT338_18185 [Thermomicrobiales bacterium]|nr:hypothetical protein [Thermomicrobiales bacterium]